MYSTSLVFQRFQKNSTCTIISMMLSTVSLAYRRPSDSLVAVAVFVFVLLAASASRTSQKDGHIRKRQNDSTQGRTTPPYSYYDNGYNEFDPNVTEYWFDAVVDHFNFRPTPEVTFKLRYFVNDQHYQNSSSPVLFYAGNEADILQFVKNSGFLWEAAQELGGQPVRRVSDKHPWRLPGWCSARQRWANADRR